MDATEYLMWQMAEAHEKLLGIQTKQWESSEERVDQIYNILMPSCRHYMRIVKDSGLFQRVLTDIGTERGDHKYSRARVYNTPNKMHRVLKNISDLFETVRTAEGPHTRAVYIVSLFDAITDSIHGSSYIDIEIAKTEPMSENLENDVTVITYMAQAIADDSPKWAKDRLLQHLRGDPRALK